MTERRLRVFRLPAAFALLTVPGIVFLSVNADAACITTGQTTACDASAPNPTTSIIGTGNNAAEDNRVVTIQNGSSVAVGDSNAISLRDRANVSVLTGGSVSAQAVNGAGLYSTGANTIEFRNNGQLTVQQGGQVLSNGTQGQAEAVNLQGSGNVITNSGLIYGKNAAAIWFQNTSGLNTVVNTETGVIQAPNNVIGASGNGAVDFTNRGKVIGNLFFAGGNDTLRLYTGSSISGNFSGGAGNDTVFLNGTGASTLPGNFTGFESLIKDDSGTWTLSGTITGVTRSEVVNGTLVLTGTNTNYTGSVLVDTNGTLEARAQSLPPSVTDNGLVRFNQPDPGTFSGALSGVGAVEKTGAGVLTLAPASGANTYSGGTTITQGTLAIATDTAIGATTGALTFNGGTFQITQNLDLAATRAVSINAPGGTFDTQGFASTLAQGVTGAGGLTKTGSGTLTMTGANTYGGGTTIAAGTLQLGNGGTTGSIVGNVANNGALVFNRSDTQTFAGAITGTGSVTQAGAGTTILTANNPYSGGTTVSAGTLAVGDAAHPGAALSGNGATLVTSAATLGGYGTVTGNVNNAGTIAVADALPAFASSGAGALTINGALTNAGLAAIGGAGVGNRLNVVGNYIGQNGVIGLNTFVAGDNAASDRLVVSGAGSTATGTSSLKITNVGGPGAQTLANGIQVIEASGGATTDLSAFRLAAPVKAGAYSYYLAKGGVTDGTSQNWYLRNEVPAAKAVPPAATAALPVNPSQPVSDQNPIAPPDTPTAAPGTPPTLAAAVDTPTNAAATPVYRPEAPVYAAIPMVARQIGIQQIDTFHDRQGEQSLLSENGNLPAAWGRVWGGHTVQSQDGALNPEFEGAIYGAQAGHDIYADSRPSGHRNHYGFFVGFTRATGDVNGYALGTPNLDVGHLAINGYSLGAYWTHIGPSGWYTDTVLMGTSLTIDPMSNDGTGATTHGRAVSGSVEAGLPIPIAYGLSVEPQAQIIWQNLSINDLNDGVSSVSFKHGNTFLGRLGVRISGDYAASFAALQPYLRLSVLRNFGAGDDVTFGGTTTLPGAVGQTAGQIGAGLVAKISKSSSAYATVSYLANLGGAHQRTITGNAGVRWAW